MNKEPNAGLNPRTPRQRPETQTDAQPTKTPRRPEPEDS